MFLVTVYLCRQQAEKIMLEQVGSPLLTYREEIVRDRPELEFSQGDTGSYHQSRVRARSRFTLLSKMSPPAPPLLDPTPTAYN